MLQCVRSSGSDCDFAGSLSGFRRLQLCSFGSRKPSHLSGKVYIIFMDPHLCYCSLESDILLKCSANLLLCPFSDRIHCDWGSGDLVRDWIRSYGLLYSGNWKWGMSAIYSGEQTSCEYSLINQNLCFFSGFLWMCRSSGMPN